MKDNKEEINMSRDIHNKYWDEELETLPREELEKRQLEDLKEIVQFAYDNAPYYKRSFDEAGAKPSDIKTLKDIQKFPFIDKKTQCSGRRRGVYFHILRLHRRAHHEPLHKEGL